MHWNIQLLKPYTSEFFKGGVQVLYCSTCIPVLFVSMHLADSHTVQINFTSIINEIEAIKNLEKSLKDISEWMCFNRLKINPSKTEFSLFGRRNQQNVQ